MGHDLPLPTHTPGPFTVTSISGNKPSVAQSRGPGSLLDTSLGLLPARGQAHCQVLIATRWIPPTLPPSLPGYQQLLPAVPLPGGLPLSSVFRWSSCSHSCQSQIHSPTHSQGDRLKIQIDVAVLLKPLRAIALLMRLKRTLYHGLRGSYHLLAYVILQRLSSHSLTLCPSQADLLSIFKHVMLCRATGPLHSIPSGLSFFPVSLTGL